MDFSQLRDMNTESIYETAGGCAGLRDLFSSGAGEVNTQAGNVGESWRGPDADAAVTAVEGSSRPLDETSEAFELANQVLSDLASNLDADKEELEGLITQAEALPAVVNDSGVVVPADGDADESGSTQSRASQLTSQIAAVVEQATQHDQEARDRLNGQPSGNGSGGAGGSGSGGAGGAGAGGGSGAGATSAGGGGAGGQSFGGGSSAAGGSDAGSQGTDGGQGGSYGGEQFGGSGLAGQGGGLGAPGTFGGSQLPAGAGTPGGAGGPFGGGVYGGGGGAFGGGTFGGGGGAFGGGGVRGGMGVASNAQNALGLHPPAGGTGAGSAGAAGGQAAGAPGGYGGGRGGGMFGGMGAGRGNGSGSGGSAASASSWLHEDRDPFTTDTAAPPIVGGSTGSESAEDDESKTEKV